MKFSLIIVVHNSI